jgi:hypothetical protein
VALAHLNPGSFQQKNVKNLKEVLYFIQLKINQSLKIKQYQYLVGETQH